MHQQLVSPGTAATLLVGVLLSVVYVRYMWGALGRAVLTRDEVDSSEDRY